MIKETVNDCRFADVLLADEYASWTYGATKALFDYYEQLSEDIGEDIELDRVAIRCEWTEYNSAKEASDQYGRYYDINDTPKNIEAQAREWLESRTTVLDVENIDTSASEYRTINSILVMQF